ncbi:hypothetical protein ACJJTC_003473 [Scirpophaga incertulas]
MANALEEAHKLLREKIEYGQSLMENLYNFQHIDGVPKLHKKIRQEIEFLNRLQKSKKFKVEQLSCSNLRHLGAMVQTAVKPGVLAVCKVFHLNDDNKLLVDIISNKGKVWTKVIARNPKSLTALSTGKASYGARSILDQAEDYLECAKLYPCMYQPPQVIFDFTSGIEESLAKKLKIVGVIVKGDIIPDSLPIEDYDEEWDSSSSELDSDSSRNLMPDFKEEHADLNTLNLDVTTMMAYISNMTNGYCNYVFKQDVLTQQSAWETDKPVKPILEKLFEGKNLVCCQTAWDDFQKIVDILGGPMERSRAIELKEIITVFPDTYGGEDDYPRKNLKVRGHVRLRSKIVFNFGHRIKALTVSANEGFVRAALQQGVSYAAFLHESRALTEGKQDSATMIQR